MTTDWTKEDSEELAAEVRPVMADILALDRTALADARRELSRYEATGPLLDPTAWMNGRGQANRRALERLEALIECYDRLVEIGGAMEDLTDEQKDAVGGWEAAMLQEAPRDG